MQASAEEEEQLSCLRSWIASVIGDVCPSDLRAAFRDSQCLVALVDALDASKVLAPELSPRTEEDALLNFATIIDFLNRRGFRLATNAQGLMMSRDVKGVLQVLWAMAEFFVCIPQFSRYSQGKWREGAKRWVDAIVKRGAASAVEVEDFSSSFKDGVILLVIIAQAWPEAHVDVEMTVRQGHQECVELALCLAEQKFQVPSLLTPQEIMRGASPSCLLLYLACLHDRLVASDATAVVSPDFAGEKLLEAVQGRGDGPPLGGRGGTMEKFRRDGIKVDELLPTVDGGVICVLCMRGNVRPRWLGCFHAFCLDCLEAVAARSDDVANVRCPVCDFVSEIDLDDLAAMDDDGSTKILEILSEKRQTCNNCDEKIATLWCETCRAALCQHCSHELHKFRMTSVKQHHVVPLQAGGKKPTELRRCFLHQDEEVLFLSISSQQLVCRECVLSGQHRDDYYVTIKEAGEQAKKDLADMLQKVEGKLRGLEKMEEQVKSSIAGKKDQLIRKLLSVDEKTEGLVREIEEREKLARENTNFRRDREMNAAVLEHRNLCEHIARLQGSINFTKTLMSNMNDLDMLRFAQLQARLLDAEKDSHARAGSDLSVFQSGGEVQQLPADFQLKTHAPSRPPPATSQLPTRLASLPPAHGAVPARSLEEDRGWGVERGGGGGVLFALGGFDGVKNLSSVEYFEPAREGGGGREGGSWQRSVEMSTPRRGLCAVFLGGKLYAMGGWDGRNYLDSMEVFDCKERRWSEGPRMLSPRCFAAAAAMEEEESFCVVGGYFGASNLRSAEYFHVPSGEWRALPEMLAQRRGLGAAWLAGPRVVVATGGWDGKRSLASVELLEWEDPSKWREMARLQIARCSLACAVSNDRLLVFGGWDGKSYLASVEELEVPGGSVQGASWKLLPPMSVPRSYCAASGHVHKGNMNFVVLGGWDGDGAARLSSAEMLSCSPTGQHWQRLPDMTSPRYGSACCWAILPS